MKDREILQKAIDRALSNGFEAWWTPYLETKNGIKIKIKYKETLEGLAIQFTDKGDESWDLYSKGGLLDWSNGYVFSIIPANCFILSYDFARAFWADCNCSFCEESNRVVASWAHHVQVMVLEEEPIKYLERFLSA